MIQYLLMSFVIKKPVEFLAFRQVTFDCHNVQF